MGVMGWLVAWFFRWLPHAAPTGLFPVGSPGENSPVLVTANFSLTVKRVRAALQGRDAWLLVANSGGINVWCAAAGGIFTAERVIDAIKVSRLAEKVKAREVILPALAAPGLDRKAIKNETGFRARFGPVYAAAVPAYLDAGRQKTEPMRRFRFDLKHRLDMFVPMNFPTWLGMALILAVFARHHLIGATIIFWAAVAVLYLFINRIPGKSGWTQAAISAAVVVLAWAGLDWLRLGDPLIHWGWFIATFAIFFAVGFDLAGIASARKSDPEQLMLKLGIKSLGSLFSEKEHGEIAIDRDKCDGCMICFELCPVGVYGERDPDHKVTFRDQEACFACTACVKQCPKKALSLAPE
ncbi:MAG TPA: HgcAB-like fusion protein [bacterium]|nr:HgcAB-like fusion protein [bacterium]